MDALKFKEQLEGLLQAHFGDFRSADVDCSVKPWTDKQDDAETTEKRLIANESTEASFSGDKAPSGRTSKSMSSRRERARNCRRSPKNKPKKGEKMLNRPKHYPPPKKKPKGKKNLENRPKKYKTGRKIVLWREQAAKIPAMLLAKDKAAATHLLKKLYDPVKRKPYDQARSALNTKEEKKPPHNCGSCRAPRKHHVCIFFRYDADSWARIKQLLPDAPEVSEAEPLDKSKPSENATCVVMRETPKSHIEGSLHDAFKETMEVPSPFVSGPTHTNGDGAANGAMNEGEVSVRLRSS
jgi:hypothetical protein